MNNMNRNNQVYKIGLVRNLKKIVNKYIGNNNTYKNNLWSDRYCGSYRARDSRRHARTDNYDWILYNKGKYFKIQILIFYS